MSFYFFKHTLMTTVRIQSNKIVLHGVKGNHMLFEL